MLNKLTVGLESSLDGFHLIEAVITEQNYLIITYIYKSHSESIVYMAPSEWMALEFVELNVALIEKIEAALPVPKSNLSH